MNDDDVVRCWDANAEVWARHVQAGYDTYRLLYNNPAFFEFVGDVAGLTVLDAGCGEGYNTRLFARRGGRMTGIDISARMIELARAAEVREPLGISYEIGSMADMAQFADRSFDAIVSTMAIMDCADYEGAVSEFGRVLKAGGLLAFSLCHPCFPYTDSEWQHDEEGRPVGLRRSAWPTERRWRRIPSGRKPRATTGRGDRSVRA